MQKALVWSQDIANITTLKISRETLVVQCDDGDDHDEDNKSINLVNSVYPEGLLHLSQQRKL